jgi:hypothetical protein
MTAFGRRHSRRFGAALFCSAIALSVSLEAAQADTRQLSMTVHIGYSNSIKLGQWMPISVDVTNTGPNVDGMLEIVSSNNSALKGGPPASSGSAVYEMPLSLADGATKHLHTFVLENQPGAVTVRAVQGGRVLASQQVTVTNTFGVLLAVVSDQPDMLSSVASVQPGGLSPGVVHLTAADLPDSGLALRAFDLLAIDDLSTDTLTAGQRTAIVDYVTNGGALLLGTGGSWHKTLGGLPAAIVPMEISGSTTLGPAASLGGQSGVEIATGSLSGGSSVWLSEGGLPLIVEKPVGQGIVAMATFDWNQDVVAGWSGTSGLLRQVFVRSTFGIGASPGGSSNGGPFAGPIAMAGNSVSQVLGNLPALNLPAWWMIGSLVFIYVLLVGPINYFSLRRLNRRALAWVTVPTIAIVASAGAYGASVLTKGRSVQATQVAILHTSQGWDRAYGEAYTGILTPARGDYQVGISGRAALISPLDTYYGGPYSSQSSIRVDTTNDGITLPGMTAFTLRGFATESFSTIRGLVLTATLVNGKIAGTLTNASAIPLTDGVVVMGNAYQRFGALAPGAAATFSFAPSVGNAFNGQPASLTIYPSNLYGQGGPVGNSSDAEREAEGKSAVLSMLPVSGQQGLIGSAMPTAVGWSTQPFQDITVDGSRPRLYALTAIVATTVVDQIGAGSLAAGVVPGRPIDIDGQVQPQAGPPGYLFVQGGSVTYDFAPRLAVGAHLGNVSISSVNSVVGAKILGPNGASAIKGQLWDWTRSSWIDVTYLDGGSTSVPDSAVNPSTGEVRLKLGSDGMVASGWLSLTGEVH